MLLSHLKGAVSRNSAKLGNYRMPAKSGTVVGRPDDGDVGETVVDLAAIT